jgi:hypothetical protein
MKFGERRPFANPDLAARKLIEIANSVEPAQDGRIYMERVHFWRPVTAATTSAPGSSAPLRSAGCGCTRAGPI